MVIMREIGVAAVPMTLSIKNAPDEMVTRLKHRAQTHHRSLQEEIPTILEDALRAPRTLTPRDALAEIQRIGLTISSESASIVRSDRDGR